MCLEMERGAEEEEGGGDGEVHSFFTASASRRRRSRWCDVELSSAAVLSGSLASGRTVASESEFWFCFESQSQSVCVPEDRMPSANFSKTLYVCVYVCMCTYTAQNALASLEEARWYLGVCL
jgi:hypothetical protein